ncbi:sodium-dependent transporter [Symmachiella dynata]|uniref:sodium-dependent transporter n=1 Tax=Symmachiella dynata TaxID=2527995 RepID=UPI001188D6A4|nr:sodium-dependent transporter [Symmachiella dynata]QDT48374.1 Sodium:neurotransmitter symporter family protein [Symmachiella dynata]
MSGQPNQNGVELANANVKGNPDRGGFATNFGFIMAAVGSAVGLGNIWKFPYITGEYGGGAFVLVYLICIAIVGLPLMYAELIIGRRGGSDILGAMRNLAAEGSVLGRILAYLTGGMAVASGFLILSFYAVVAGWALHFLAVSLGLMPDAQLGAEGTFAEVAGSAKLSSLWHTIFMALTMIVVMGGIHGGIEKLCKILMPVLFLMLIALLIYVGYTGGLEESLTFLFKPDFHKLSAAAVLEALGHAFFTLSLGMGAIVTYGSYLKSERHVIRDGIAIAFLDTLIALMAGTVIFAVVFHAGLEAEGGPGLLFKTLPALFIKMPYGAAVSSFFFLLVVFAAWSSAVSLLEVVVAYFVDEWKMKRSIATCVFGGLVWGLGIASACDGSVLDFLDNLTTRYMLPLGGLAIAIFAGWFVSYEDRNSGFAPFGVVGEMLAAAWLFTIRFVSPVLIVIVILSKTGALDSFIK